MRLTLSKLIKLVSCVGRQLNLGHFDFLIKLIDFPSVCPLRNIKEVSGLNSSFSNRFEGFGIAVTFFLLHNTIQEPSIS